MQFNLGRWRRAKVGDEVREKVIKIAVQLTRHIHVVGRLYISIDPCIYSRKCLNEKVTHTVFISSPVRASFLSVKINKQITSCEQK